MSYAFSDAQAKLSVLLQDSNTGTDDAWPLAIRKKELNRGELQFAKDTKIYRNKAAGTLDASNKLEVPADWLETVCLVVNNYVLNSDREIAVKDYDRYRTYNGTYPFYYMTQESGTRYFVFLGSVTGVAYVLHYIARPTTELSDNDDTSVLPEEYREAPVYYAAAQLLQQVGKSEYADRYLAIYTRLVRDGQEYAERTYMSKQYANPDTNAVDYGDSDVQGYSYDFGGM
jgi:hypothetical protein